MAGSELCLFTLGGGGILERFNQLPRAVYHWSLQLRASFDAQEGVVRFVGRRKVALSAPQKVQRRVCFMPRAVLNLMPASTARRSERPRLSLVMSVRSSLLSLPRALNTPIEPPNKCLSGHAPLPCCRMAVHTAIGSARRAKEDHPSERMVANCLKAKLGSENFRQFNLDEVARVATGQSVAYVMMPDLVASLKGKELDVGVLQDPGKYPFIFSTGEGQGSLYDLVHQTCSPPTTFPSTSKGVWDSLSNTDENGAAHRSRRSSRAGGEGARGSQVQN